jgi:hypothetical protein
MANRPDDSRRHRHFVSQGNHVATGWWHALGAALLLLAGCTQGGSGGQPYASQLPQVSKSYTVPPYQLHVLPGGKEVELAGGMPIGTSEAVRQMLEATPGIQVIHLNNEGGQVLEGYELGQVIKNHHLTTYTSTGCNSACTLAFIAGAHRYLGPGAVLGFHSASRFMGGDSWAQGNNAMRDLYQQAGLPQSFIDKALATPPSDIWYPTPTELISAHIIDGVVPAGRFAKSGLAYWQNEADLDVTLRQNALYLAIAENDPPSYRRIMAIYLKGAKTGRAFADVDDEASRFTVDDIFPAYFDKASDATILNYQRNQLAQVKFLLANDSASCAAMVFPKLGIQAKSAVQLLPMSLKTDEMDTLAMIAQSSFTQGHVPTSAAANHQALVAFLTHLKMQSPETAEAIWHPATFRDSPDKLCHAIVDMFQSIVDLPGDQAALIGRALMGSHSS